MRQRSPVSILKDIQERYRMGATLPIEDKLHLKHLIIYSDEASSLQSAFYLYGMNFEKDQEIVDRASHFIREEPLPGLTATCLKVVADFWSMHDNYRNELEKYLDYELYDVWYDELTVCVSFFLRHLKLQNETVTLKLMKVEQQARMAKDVGLLDFFDAYKAS